MSVSMTVKLMATGKLGGGGDAGWKLSNTAG
jgi:hypothetical protein